MSEKRLAVTIVGAGGLARAMASALTRSHRASVTIVARRPAAASVLARGTRGVLTASTIEASLVDAAIVLLAVPDRAIAELAAALAPARRSWRGVVVLHAAGAYGPELLAPLRAQGAATGVLHPLAVLGGQGGAALASASARIEGSQKAVAAARRLCALVGLVPLRGVGLLTPQGRSGYHAAASLVSNDVIALLAAGQGVLVRRGVPKGDALRALLGLAEGALAQLRRSGFAGALTGPVARNDGATLTAQLRALRADDPAAGEAHRALSLRLVALALALGRLTPEAARDMTRTLARGRGRSVTL